MNGQEYLNLIGSRLRKMRRRSGKRRLDIYVETGISPTTATAYERGEMCPGLINLKLLVDCYGRTMEELFADHWEDEG